MMIIIRKSEQEKSATCDNILVRLLTRTITRRIVYRLFTVPCLILLVTVDKLKHFTRQDQVSEVGSIDLRIQVVQPVSTYLIQHMIF